MLYSFSFMSLHIDSLHLIFFHIILHHFVLFVYSLYNLVLRCVLLCYVMLCYVMRYQVTTAQEAFQLVAKGNKVRAVGSTQCNDVSSRCVRHFTLLYVTPILCEVTINFSNFLLTRRFSFPVVIWKNHFLINLITKCLFF